MHGCDVAKWCLPSVSQIQISLTLFNVYTLQHAHFQTTLRISQLYSRMNGFQTSCSLIQIFEFNFILIMTSPSLLHPHSRLLFCNCTTNFLPCMHAHTVPVGIIHRTHAIFFFWSVSHACTHTPPPLHHIGHSLSLTCMRNDRCSSMCVYIARSFIVFHTNRSIYISSEVSPSFPRLHRSIYTSLYRITWLIHPH